MFPDSAGAWLLQYSSGEIAINCVDLRALSALLVGLFHVLQRPSKEV